MKLQRPMAQNKTMFERSRLKLHHNQKNYWVSIPVPPACKAGATI